MKNERVECTNGFYLNKTLRAKLMKILEGDLIEADRNYDLAASRKILSITTSLTREVEDTIGDIELHLAELRAQILTIVCSWVPSVEHIVWEKENGRIRIHCGFPINEDTIFEIKAAIKEKFQHHDLDKIMSEPMVQHEETLTWRWVC